MEGLQGVEVASIAAGSLNSAATLGHVTAGEAYTWGSGKAGMLGECDLQRDRGV